MPADKQSVLGEQVYRKIRKKILSGELKPGEKIPEHKLVSEFEVSRTPVREAMRRLAGDGLIIFHPNHSAVVVKIDQAYVRELGTVRVALDCLSVVLAVHNAKESDFDELERLAQQCAVAEAEDDLSQVVSINGRFHKYLVKLGNNHVLSDLQTQFFRRAKFVQSLLSKPYNLESHLALVAAIRHRDAEEAIRVLLDDLCSAYQLDMDEIKKAMQPLQIVAGVANKIPESLSEQ